MLEVYHQEYNNLKIFPVEGILERHIGLLNDLGEDLNIRTLCVLGNQEFVSKKCSERFKICNKANIVYITDKSIYDTEVFKDMLSELVKGHLPTTNSSKGNLPIILAPTTEILEMYGHIYNLSKIEYDEFFKQ